MKQPHTERAEGRAERTLRLLARVPPPQGMDARLNAAVARAVEGAHGRRRGEYLTRGVAGLTAPRWTVGIAVAVLVLILHWQGLGRDRRHTANPGAGNAEVKTPAAQDSKPMELSGLSSAHSSRAVARARLTVARERVRAVPREERVAAVRDLGDAASFPAPVAPLTEQERLLVVLARRWSDAERPEMASLMISEPVLRHGLLSQVPQPAGESGDKQ